MTGSRLDWVIAACSARPGAVEDYPFGDGVAVFKVAGRMFQEMSEAMATHFHAGGRVCVLRCAG